MNGDNIQCARVYRMNSFFFWGGGDDRHFNVGFSYMTQSIPTCVPKLSFLRRIFSFFLYTNLFLLASFLFFSCGIGFNMNLIYSILDGQEERLCLLGHWCRSCSTLRHRNVRVISSHNLLKARTSISNRYIRVSYKSRRYPSSRKKMI